MKERFKDGQTQVAELRLLPMMVIPKAMRQQVGKPNEGFPSSGSLRQSMIESAVYNQILAKRI
jgi:hypothetical protein